MAAFPTQLFINNQFVAGSGDKLSISSPTDGSLVQDNIPSASPQDVDAAVSAARAAFPSWRDLPAAQRTALMLKLADLIDEHTETLAKFEVDAIGCPIVMARMAIGMSTGQLRYYAKLAGSVHGDAIPEDGSGMAKMVYYEPLGVCGSIAPWNGTMFFWSWKVAPAIAAGNTVIFKASEKSPLGPLYVGKLIVEAGFPPGVINAISGDGKVGALLASHMDINKISFTGSTATGRKIQIAAAQSNLKIVTLELGGKSAALVFDDADLDNAAQQISMGVLGNSGQSCNANSRVLVQESIAEVFIQKLKTQFDNFAKGLADPRLESTFMGPLADVKQFQHVMRFLDQAKEDGLDVLVGGGRGPQEGGCFVHPTLIREPGDEHPVYRDEIFGPVASLKTFKTEEDGVEIANKTSYGLGASFYTKDVGRTMRLIPKLQAGTIGVNSAYFPQKDVPFGGWKQSGTGREGGVEGYKAYLQSKSVQIKL